MLRLEPSPRLAPHFVQCGLVSEVTLLDAGARYGAPEEWGAFGDALRVIAFEADNEEAQRLRAQARPGWTVFPVALAAEQSRRQLFLTRFPAGSSLYRTIQLFDRVENRENVEVVGTTEIQVHPLDALRVGPVDFAKLDVELAELDVLRGARETIGGALAVEMEIHFPKRPRDAGCFAEVDEFMRGLGFELFDLDVYRFARRALVSPPVYDYRDDRGEPTPGPTVEGQVLTGDALYVRDIVRSGAGGAREIALLAAFYEIHRLRDCAAELLTERGGELGVPIEPLLDLLAIEADALRSEDGRAYGPNYHVFEELWRQRAAPSERASRDDPPASGTLARLRKWIA